MTTMPRLFEAGRTVYLASPKLARTTVNSEHAMNGPLHMFGHQQPTNFLAITRPNKPLQPTAFGGG